MKKDTYTPPKYERVQLMPEGLIAASGDKATKQADIYIDCTSWM